jgi:hypothetical protein
LANGVKFVLIAVKANNAYVSHAEYTIVGTTPTLTSAEAVHVPASETQQYRFICVSLNNATSPSLYAYDTFEEGAVPTFTNIPNTVDLLYWTSGNMPVNENKVLPVTLRHRFNYVKVKLNSSYNEWNILGINADSIRFNSYSTVALNSAGAVSGIATKKPVSWPSSLTPDTVQESLGDTVYLSSLDMYIGANTLTLSVGNFPSAATIAAFSSASYTAGGGKSYVLTLKLKQPMFASSDIYWDTSKTPHKLMFKGYSNDPDGTYGDTVKYQGVYFKFGSLVGISPQGDFNVGSTALYVPQPADGSYITYANSSHSGIIGWSGSDYASIPYATATPAVTENRYDRFVIDMPDSSAYMKGDICQYLQSIGDAPDLPAGKTKWRLPISKEFGTTDMLITWGTDIPKDGWLRVDGPNGGSFAWNTETSGNLADGTRTSIGSGGKFGINGLFFPVSGIRNSLSDQVNTGQIGYYWSGSAYSEYAGYSLYLLQGFAFPFFHDNRKYAMPVRCVLE